MIKTISVTNHLGDSITLELRFPEKSGFLVLDTADGFGPPKASINMTDVVAKDGSKFNSARVEKRNIILPLKFIATPGGETIEELRHKAYKYFPIKKPVTLRIETDTRVSETFGYVESDIPTIFDSSEGTTISILCPEPYFYSVDSNVTLLTGVTKLFEFPFSNESLTQKTLQMGTIENMTTQSVYYDGDADTGVVIYIHALGAASDIKITNTRTREVMEINTAYISTLTGTPLSTGDDIIISTVRGEKWIYLQRAGVFYNIRNCLGRNADWFQISKGDNLFAYTATGIANLQFRIENKILYEGI